MNGFTAGVGSQPMARTPRTVENAINEIQRAIDRLSDATMKIQINADRLHGPIPVNPTVGGQQPPQPAHEAFVLGEALSRLHTCIDALDEQARRFDLI